MSDWYRGAVEVLTDAVQVSATASVRQRVNYYTKPYKNIGTARAQTTVLRKQLEKNYRMVDVWTEKVLCWERVD